MNVKQREQITRKVEENAEYIEESLNNYLIENILSQIEGVATNDLNALSQAKVTFLKLMVGD